VTTANTPRPEKRALPDVQPETQEPETQEDDTDACHLASLRAASGTVLSEYMSFLAKEAPEEAKMFAARHAAGKAAVGHLMALTRLLQASLMASSAPVREDDNAMGDLLVAARQAMSAYDDGGDHDA